MDATTFNIGICEMSAELFGRSIEKGYDSKDFIEKLMNSETAEHLYNKMDTQMWLGVNYIIDTLVLSYQGLHVMSFEDAIVELKHIYIDN